MSNKERPIIFSAPMVRALLSGEKTQTRRAMKLKPHQQIEERDDGAPRPWMYDNERDADVWLACPYGQPGDRLWVRETFQYRGASYDGHGIDESEWFRCYGAGGAADNWDPDYPHGWWPTPHMNVKKLDAADEQEGEGVTGWVTKRIPGIHMPRWASRITLEVTSVRVERLNDISESDCWAEGIEEVMYDFDDAAQIDMPNRLGCCIEDAKPLYALLWEQINGKGSWDANPWVWVVEHKRIAQEEGAA